MIAKSARRAGAALCIHVPPAGFLGRAECGGRKHHMAIGMLDHTAGIATACGAEPVVITSSSTRRAARATYSAVLTYISNPVVFVLEAGFLLTVTIHTMLGIRSILHDLDPAPAPPVGSIAPSGRSVRLRSCTAPRC